MRSGFKRFCCGISSGIIKLILRRKGWSDKWTCFRSEQLDYWKIMCTKNSAVTKLRYSLAKQWGKSNRRLTNSLRIICLKGKGAVSLFFFNAAVVTWVWFSVIDFLVFVFVESEMSSVIFFLLFFLSVTWKPLS